MGQKINEINTSHTIHLTEVSTMEKNKTEKGENEYRESEGAATISKRVVRKGLSKNVRFEQILERADDSEPRRYLECHRKGEQQMQRPDVED